MRICYYSAGLERADRVQQGGALTVRGQQVGNMDSEGNVTLQGELAGRLFTIKDDPYADIQANDGVRTLNAIWISYGSKWREVGTTKPTSGTELTNKKLAKALKETTDFTEMEWKEFGVEVDMSKSHYIKSGYKYFKPHDQQVSLTLRFRYSLKEGSRVRLPSPEFARPCCATVVEVKSDSIVCAIDNSEEKVELSHDHQTTIQAYIHRLEGQRLMVLHEGKLTDATVVAPPSDQLKPARHRLLLPTGTEIEQDLNEFNHCVQRLESVSAFEAARASFCASLRDTCSTLQDAITGAQLRVEDQTLQINPDYSRGVQRERWVSAPTITDLTPLLLEPSSSRPCGAHEICPALIEPPPGTGKVRTILRMCFPALTLCAQLAGHDLLCNCSILPPM